MISGFHMYEKLHYIYTHNIIGHEIYAYVRCIVCLCKIDVKYYI